MSAHRDLGMPMALEVARLIHADLALSSASAWHWWLAVSNSDYKDGLLYTDWRQPGDAESILISKAFWALGNFSRFVRPGMVRVELKGDAHALAALVGSAYVDPQTHRLVLIYVNSGKETQTVRWSFKGTAGGPANFTPYVTSASANLKGGRTFAANGSAEIPAESIVTFVGN